MWTIIVNILIAIVLAVAAGLAPAAVLSEKLCAGHPNVFMPVTVTLICAIALCFYKLLTWMHTFTLFDFDLRTGWIMVALLVYVGLKCLHSAMDVG